MDARQHLSRISELLSSYVTKRDNMVAVNHARAEGSAIIPATNFGASGPMAFSQLLNDHAAQLRDLLPVMSQAQMEALHELTGVALAEMRRIASQS